jgi:hypothetical protein
MPLRVFLVLLSAAYIAAGVLLHALAKISMLAVRFGQVALALGEIGALALFIALGERALALAKSLPSPGLAGVLRWPRPKSGIFLFSAELS